MIEINNQEIFTVEKTSKTKDGFRIAKIENSDMETFTIFLDYVESNKKIKAGQKITIDLIDFEDITDKYLVVTVLEDETKKAKEISRSLQNAAFG